MSSSELGRPSRLPVGRLALLTGAALLIHGYHLGTDDAGIWVPAIKKAANPALYPFGAEFFQMHGGLSLFPLLAGGFARLTQLPVDLVIFLCHLLGVFLLLAAGWRLLSACVKSEHARWCGVALLAGVLSVPVAGTALPIMDPYVTSRTLSTPLATLAVAWYLTGRLRRALAWLGVCALIHPQMSMYAVALVGSLEYTARRAAKVHRATAAAASASFAAGWWPFAWNLSPARGPAAEALHSRTYFFVYNWAWYEWVGAAAPLLLLWAAGRTVFRGAKPALQPLLRSLVLFGLLFTAAGVLVSSSPRLENFARLQPMRAFHLLYIVLFLVAGALAGEYLLKGRRWLALFVPLAFAMVVPARAGFPNSPQVEWPGAAPRGDWCEAFLWIRGHTPADAVFALDPGYLLLAGEDMHGFRAVADRSMLADRVKDSGAVSLFPQLAEDWERQVRAADGLSRFQGPDFRKIASLYPVTWVVVQNPPASGLDCRYRNRSVSVCRIPSEASGFQTSQP